LPLGSRADFLQTVSAGRGNEQRPTVTAATFDRVPWAPVENPRLGLAVLVDRIGRGLSRRGNWFQLFKFGLVGATGYVVNLAVYAFLLERAIDFRAAAVASFLVAVVNNYTLNRQWTFRDARGHVGYQGLRFFVVSTTVLAANVVALSALVALGVGKLPAQAVAIVLVMPLNFVGNKLWTFKRHTAGRR
jgi:putative flippase GtrA